MEQRVARRWQRQYVLDAIERGSFDFALNLRRFEELVRADTRDSLTSREVDALAEQAEREYYDAQESAHATR